MIDRLAIRAAASRHIEELGLVTPPFDCHRSLQARRLQLLDEPLEAVLAESGLPPEAQEQIDGFIDLRGRIICLRGSLHRHQVHIAILHEVAHDLLPWQRDLLFYCPVFSLPDHLQFGFEREATAFAIECTFFAERFLEEIQSSPAHLNTAMALSDRFAASYESTFRHYAECHPSPCVLLISMIHEIDDESGEVVFEMRQYIRSANTTISIRPGQRFRNRDLSRLVGRPYSLTGIMEHEFRLRTSDGVTAVRAQSFWNTYKLFTMLWVPS